MRRAVPPCLLAWLCTSLLLGTTQALAEQSAAQPTIGVLVRQEPHGSFVYEDGVRTWRLVEGDILVPIEAPPRVGYHDDFWDSGNFPHVVRYDWDSNVPPDKRSYLRGIFDEIEDRFDLLFEECDGSCSTVRKHVSIESTSADDCPGCDCTDSATVGEPWYIHGSMKLCRGWDRTGVAQHEIGHVLGLKHEQVRPDRDAYVNVHFDRIADGCDPDNWEADDDAIPLGPYDFGSVMHYGGCQCALAPCPPRFVIEALPPYEDQQAVMGQRDGYSALDELFIQLAYRREEWVIVDAYGEGDRGTLDRPYRELEEGIGHALFGTVWILPGDYDVPPLVLGWPMTWRAPLGGVRVH